MQARASISRAVAIDWARVAARAAETRPVRIVVIIGAIWLLNLFDVSLTILAHRQGVLEEVNPLAVRMLSIGPAALLVYKIVLIGLGSATLWAAREHRLAEMAAWGMLATYTLVALHWRVCYEVYLIISSAQAGLGSGFHS